MAITNPPEILYGQKIFNGPVSFGSTVSLPETETVVGDEQCSASRPLATSKTRHRVMITYQQALGSDVVSQSMKVYTAPYDGTLTRVIVTPDTGPAGGGDKKFTVDVQKVTPGGAYATVLTGVVDIGNGHANNTPEEGGISGSADDYTANDSFKVIIAASGSTGTQAQGLNVTLVFDEDPS